MAMTEEQIRTITEDIVRSLLGNAPGNAAAAGPAGIAPVSPAASPRTSGAPSGRAWLCDTMAEAVENAGASQRRLAQLSLEKRGELIAAMRKAGVDNAELLARYAYEDTGYGHIEDKIKKNLLAANHTPGIEDLETEAHTGDRGMTIMERAPFGVIGSITPSTNPTATIINNAISMIAAGNGVVFNPHPSAKRASLEAMRILNEAIVKAGGPPCLIASIKEPSLESGQALMEHPDVPLLSVTGGEAVVKVAMKSGKRVIAAGPGNPPVIVDDTADIQEAAKKIVDGASFDNNVLCVAEKEVFAFSNIVEKLLTEMEKAGAFRIYGADVDRVLRTVLIEKNGGYLINRKYVGRNASHILRESGVAFSGEPRLVIALVDRNHPFIMTEMLMPVLGVASVNNIDEAVEEAFRAEQGCKHSAIMHSANVHNMSKAARRMNTTIFVKNAPSYCGLGYDAEGCATFTIATPTGEGITSARTFTRYRRCVLYGDFRIV
ncbi:MAG: aldehyde dehydrogenase EutE [Treponema sp.]|jgi:propionaldehyde dehydrogenase|nr:aldehyde dehydrogenase EutE [Treponema sp.]